jgi:hypothetical protein
VVDISEEADDEEENEAKEGGDNGADCVEA